ncbi:hypothetical protein B296_00013906 [Ensete ventricosum]|uniref:TFIIS N-terminal domain-containing protein n=1 Tax=Ensete ventricosum TaxID=4639 RepID=A0A427B0Q2_ENSVE|nr:hypothetical protein B296_00013906 [Ensete ventricosum]
MASLPGSFDYWRKFFRSADSDIFGVMEHAIVVAASDYPQEFRSRRDGLVEKFFTALLPRCLGCDRVDPRGAEGEEGRGSVRRVGEKENKIGRAVNGLRKHDSKQICHLVRALIDGWKVLVDEWVSATGAIAGMLYVCLVSRTTLPYTISYRLITNLWFTDNSPDSVNPSIVDYEEGLPSPPLDEGALFTAQTTSIRLSEVKDKINFWRFPLFVASGLDTDLVWFHVSIGRRFAKFFDGMDDDGSE